jgi:hypothetical protein
VQNGGRGREGNSKFAKRLYLRYNEQRVSAEGLISN